MKKYIKNTTIVLFISLLSFSCGKEFLNQPPLDQITIDNFYQNKEQLDAATASLYGFPWFNFNDKAFAAIGDLQAGNMFTWDGAYKPFSNFSVQQSNQRLPEAWGALFKVVGMSNSVINTLPAKAASSIAPAVVNNAVGEAKFMRALAYFYLVRIWGPVPIIENSEALATGDPIVPKNNIDDVYKLIIKDLEFSEKNCSATKNVEGRVSKWTAKALLAKVYLYQENYALAQQKAEEVINSGQYQLMNSYADIFRTKNDNSAESVFAWQWVACPDCWGQQNTAQAYIAPFGQGLTETGDGWGSLMASIDLVTSYEKDDKRKSATVMTPGSVYPELKSKTHPNGFTYPTDRDISSTRANVRKYIVGAPQENGGTDGPVYFMRTGINTNIIRYSDVLLIAAEAIAKGGSTSDAKALEYFNKVRQRAGLSPKPSITQDDIMKERRVEFAMEGEYWYDLGRLDRAKAIEVIGKQQRGFYWGPGENDIVDEKFKPTEKDFYLPIPQAESDRNPLLLKEPVPYTFK
jgi:starch-binding outer membrane protein, SusD/RagB family